MPRLKISESMIWRGNIVHNGQNVDNQCAKDCHEAEARIQAKKKRIIAPVEIEEDSGDTGLNPVSDIPASFPASEALIAAGFTQEKLDSLENAAIFKIKGVTASEALAIIKALGREEPQGQ